MEPAPVQGGYDSVLLRLFLRPSPERHPGIKDGTIYCAHAPGGAEVGRVLKGGSSGRAKVITPSPGLFHAHVGDVHILKGEGMCP